jgi:hypothetical protein
MNRIVVLAFTILFGLFFLALGVSGVALEYQTPPVHTTHLVGFLALILLGAIMMPGVGAVIFAKLRDGVTLAADVAPRFGGRRDYDPQIPVVPVTPAAPAAPPPSPLDEDKK